MLRRPVFVTRKFPPMIGGMETFSFAVWNGMSASWPEAALLKNDGSQKRLVWWLPSTVLRLAVRILRGKTDFVLVGDALTYTALYPLLALTGTPHATCVMGLDITWDKSLYRALAHRALRRAPLVLAISSATASTAVDEAGVDRSRIQVLLLGSALPPKGPPKEEARRRLLQTLTLDEQSRLIVTVGRLVRRKGVRWMIENVLPKLNSNVMYLVAGDGPDGEAIAEAASAHGVGERVRLLGRVDDETRECLLRGADVFVQPNIPVPGDMEGFGLVTVEAAMRDTATVASDLEGIRDAVRDGETGMMLPSGDAEAWTATLSSLLEDPSAVHDLGQQFGARARELYSEDAMTKSLRGYLESCST